MENSIEDRIYRDVLSEADHCFPKDHLGVSDKFLLRQCVATTCKQFKDENGKLPFITYALSFALNSEMKRWGYTARNLDFEVL